MRQTLLIGLFLFCFSCSDQIVGQRSDRSPTARYYPMKVGDCFTFREGMSNYGLMLVEIVIIGIHEDYAFAPIKLNTEKKDLDQFKNGLVNIGQYTDLNGLPKIVKGFPAIHFMDKKEFDSTYNAIIAKGNLKIRPQFLRSTGGTVSDGKEETDINLKNIYNNFSVVDQENNVKAVIQQ